MKRNFSYTCLLSLFTTLPSLQNQANIYWWTKGGSKALKPTVYMMFFWILTICYSVQRIKGSVHLCLDSLLYFTGWGPLHSLLYAPFLMNIVQEDNKVKFHYTILKWGLNRIDWWQLGLKRYHELMHSESKPNNLLFAWFLSTQMVRTANGDSLKPYKTLLCWYLILSEFEDPEHDFVLIIFLHSAYVLLQQFVKASGKSLLYPINQGFSSHGTDKALK